MQPATRPTIPTMHSRDNLGTRLTPQHLQRAAHLFQRSGIVGTTFAQLGDDFRRRTLQELAVTELLVDLLDLAFQALADPTRRIMVERLSRSPASVSELARPLDMTLSAVVQHLAVLESSGLVRSEKVGRVRTCRIELAALRTAERWISERRASWERRLDRLGDFLSETERLAKPRRKK